MSSSKTVFDLAIDNLYEAGRLGKINPRALKILKAPKKINSFCIPLKLDNGEFEVFQAYRVHYCNAMGPFRNGTRIRPELTLEEIKALGIFMTIKHCVADIPAGGAKGGIRADLDAMSERDQERLIRAYVRNLAPKGPWVDVPGADIGTGTKAMSWMLDEYEQITGSNCPAAINDKPSILGGSLGGEAATGQGVFLVLQAAAKDMSLELNQVSASLQGFGQVGAEVARHLYQAGCRVVAVSDIYGGIFDQKGLDIPTLTEYVHSQGSVIDFPGAEAMTNDQVLEAEVDILIPAAVHDVIHSGNAGNIKAKLIVEGANGPLTTEADQILIDKQVTVVPDVVANSGGATVCHFERSQGLSDEYWDLDRVNACLRKRIISAYTNSKDCAQEVKTPSLRIGSWIYALKKLERAMLLRGWI